ncbi:RimK family alpha-L-glutamate ligase [Candidatus Methylospira mobilis]|uniref:RimK family alpha-L-glutamate ligase n=1 Tax=Candidatus Methylospira mobilis TaxID=1808979 RepID=A0A5Q0BU02_9GAMM|nr:RimK family alpha-L-glutamate ligase [Candidatus Methylospira mobilis]QFY45146.1 RimK family alpha-L-glutamate ligase [Candidatus Methylospira mobilis]WNV04883.1 RimK family alpha-L-glutamate ligase [Candidatus Methylospira mobilis]
MLNVVGNASQPTPLIGLGGLMRRLFAGDDLQALTVQLIERAVQNANDANAVMDVATLMFMIANRDLGLTLQQSALATQSLYRIPSARQPARLRLLVLLGPGDLMANTPVELLLEDSDISVDLLYLNPGKHLTGDDIPSHDLVFVAIGESGANVPLLEAIGPLLAGWIKPVINPPERITRLSRDKVCRLLANAPGVEIPSSVRCSRQQLLEVSNGQAALAGFAGDMTWPIIIRPLDSHAGQYLQRIDTAAALQAYLDEAPGNEFYISHFVDYAGSDGLYRKYRIALINGHPFIAHLAISENWMVHYNNAGMKDSEAKRNEEAAAMETFGETFAQRHAQAFQAINARMGLDYLAMDCAETAGGKLLLFEVDTAMVVHALDPVDLFPYKQPVMRKLFDAFRQMLIDRHAGR